ELLKVIVTKQSDIYLREIQEAIKERTEIDVSKFGKTYSADLNGSLNILRKVVGDSIFDRNSIERLVVSPVRFTPYQARNI
ncbi:MAG: hypothetical protein V7K70_19000, partial [Nostoc sp.]